MKIEAGKFYKTRDGRKVRIYATDGGGLMTVHGAIRNPHTSFPGEWVWILREWAINGNAQEDSDCDLIAEWTEPRTVSGYVNVYGDPPHLLCDNIFETEQEAIEARAPDVVSYVTIYVTGTEGVGP